VILDALDRDTREILDRYGFDEDVFERLRAEVAAGELTADSNIVVGDVEPPAPGDVSRLPEPGSQQWNAAREAGLAALSSGRVGQIVLAGGMATRFGGLVKGAVDAVDDRSFLEWKLGETKRLAEVLGTEIPVALMTSFATEDSTRAHVREQGLPEPIWFSQFVSLRLTPSGDVFRDANGDVSLYGPGHGDLLSAVRGSGTLDTLRELGAEHVAVSNVDNLGARLDPVVIGMHLLEKSEMTTEVAAKEGDAGGAPARVDGRIGLLETPQFPAAFDQNRIRVFNTNTATFTVDALDRDIPLSWLYVTKTADGERVVQLERLYHHASWTLRTTYLEVPRGGPRGRFFPIKEPDDLLRSREALREMLSSSVLDD
jgi:UTP--glucose-1-phosphate uridylyltransferase